MHNYIYDVLNREVKSLPSVNHFQMEKEKRKMFQSDDRTNFINKDQQFS